MSEFPPVVTQEQMLRRIRSEYLEMPGLRLSAEQARRLWGLDHATCTQLLQVLVESGFLSRSIGDMYARLTDGPAEQLRLPIGRSNLLPRRAARTGKTNAA